MLTETAPKSELAIIIETSGLPVNKATALLEAFTPLVNEAGKLCAMAGQILVTDATQLTEMKEARKVRLALKDVRVAAEKARKELKADALAQGKAIDSANKWLLERIEPAETQMEAAEQFAARAEAKRKADLVESRSRVLAPFGVDPIIYPLGEMSDAQWAQLLDGSRLAFEAKQAAAAKAEADRLAAEEAARVEQARIRAENDRLRSEAEAAAKAAAAERAKVEAERRAAEATARAEREKAEAELRAANEARQKAEREAQRARDEAAAKAKAEKDAADRRAKAEAEAARKAAAAPDADKLRAFAAALRAIPQPQGDAFRVARNIVGNAADAIDDLANEVVGVKL